MKKIFPLFIILLTLKTTNAQFFLGDHKKPVERVIRVNDSTISTRLVETSSHRSDDAGRLYYTTITETPNNNSFNPTRSSVSVDLSTDPKLKLAVNIKSDSLKKNWGYKILSNAELGSSNKYVPILDKGKWAPDFTGGLTFYGYHYKEAKKTNASFLHLITLQPNYNYKEYLTLKDSLYFGIEEMFNSKKKSDFNLSLSYNFYARPHKDEDKLVFLLTLGYKYQLFGNNYEKLDEVKVSQFQSFTDSLGRTLQVNYPETSGRKGDLEFSSGHTFFMEFHAVGKTDGVSIDGFAIPIVSYAVKQAKVDFKVGLNFGVRGLNAKGENAVVNIAPVISFSDLTQKFEGPDDFKRRITPGIQLAIPIPEMKQ